MNLAIGRRGAIGWRIERRWCGGAIAPVVFALVAALGSQAAAQQLNPNRESDRPGTETRTTIRGGDATRDSGRDRLLEGRDVRFEEVLAKPDDIALRRWSASCLGRRTWRASASCTPWCCTGWTITTTRSGNWKAC